MGRELNQEQTFPFRIAETIPGGSTQTGTTSGGNSRQLHRWQKRGYRGENSSKVVIYSYYYQYHRQGESRQLSGTMERGGSVGSREHLSFQDSRDDPRRQYPDGSHLRG